MRNIVRQSPLKVALAFAVAFLAACGGGGSDTTPRAKVTSVIVMGDSLADSGTFAGIKFTVNGEGLLVYPERIAQSYGIALCNAYEGSGPYVDTFRTTFVGGIRAGCTNFAVGGARVNFRNPDSPYSVIKQLQDAVPAGGYAEGDLLVIDGGGNDAADLVGAYLVTASCALGSPACAADVGANAEILGTLPNFTAMVSPALAGGAVSVVELGNAYMVALADKFADAITVHTLNRGAQRVAVLNMPAITNTPRFQTVLDYIAFVSGGGETGAAVRTQSEALFKSWFNAFNARLAARFAGDARVVVVDFYTAFDDQVNTPDQFKLSNAKTSACPSTGLDPADGLPMYDFETCTPVALSNAPPPGVTDPNWWQSYAFSDGFHPTPYGQQLLAQLISVSLARAGWL